MDIVYQQLKKVFHHDSFQEGQEEIITDILDGKDVLGILPTGAGKSLCYQLPALLLPGLTIVVSPLVSLMIDQVRQIKAYHFKEVAALHSFQSLNERKTILNHLKSYRLLFLSPELLQQEPVISRLRQVNVSLFCIDEAHCISQWGYDFRPDYLRLNTVLKEFGDPTVLALTGTAPSNIQNDIVHQLNRQSMYKHVYSMEKKNITFVVEKLQGSEQEKEVLLAEHVHRLKKPVIIYFSSRKKTEEMTAFLDAQKNIGKIAYYHAGMLAEDRLKVQEQFIYDQLDVVCCTSAFGMGINKGNIRTIIHYHPPAQLESFLQEVGRAGRDGKESLSLVLYKEGDLNVPGSIIENELPDERELSYVLQQLKKLKLEGKKLPVNKEQLEHFFQMRETKWRLLKYQLEKYNIIDEEIAPYDEKTWRKVYTDIHIFCCTRKQYKRNKLNEVSEWLNSDTCLRQKLYNSLKERVPSRGINCCSHCGYNGDDFIEREQTEKELMDSSWQEMLKQMLLIEDNEYAKSK